MYELGRIALLYITRGAELAGLAGFVGFPSNATAHISDRRQVTDDDDDDHSNNSRWTPASSFLGTIGLG
jgi:hypothetical protein